MHNFAFLDIGYSLTPSQIAHKFIFLRLYDIKF